jgi:hypothetical protein
MKSLVALTFTALLTLNQIEFVLCKNNTSNDTLGEA